MKKYRAKKSLGLKTLKSFARPKKGLGQNFLKSIPALKKIIEAGEISEQDIILEIGPGKGVLTKELLKKAGQVIAVEKDRDLFEFLQEKFKKEIKTNTLVLVHEDILQFTITNYKLGNYKIIANIPYNITGAILKKFLTAENQPERMVLMMQNEVVQRILVRNKKESILSISVKAYGEPKYILKVPARYFSPAPKVDSAVILIQNISRKFFSENKISEKKFWEIVRAGFAHKRKKLAGNLKNLLPKETLFELKNKRAEELSLLNWIRLSK